MERWKWRVDDPRRRRAGVVGGVGGAWGAKEGEGEINGKDVDVIWY